MGMKLSTLIKVIQQDIEVYGDVHALNYSYSHETASPSGFKYSPTRKKKNGERAKMNRKEFKEYVTNEKSKTPLNRKTLYNTYPACGLPGHVCNIGYKTIN